MDALKHNSEGARAGGPTPSSMRPIKPKNARYAHAGLSFEMPQPDAVEGLVLAFRTLSGAALPAPSVSLTRERRREGDSLRTHTDRALSRLGREAENFDLLESRTMDVGGHVAQKLHFTWTSHLGPMDQIMVLVDPGDDREHRVVALNVVGPLELAEETRQVFEKLVSTIRFDSPRDAEPAERAPSSPDSSPSTPSAVRAAPLSPPPPPPSRAAEHPSGPVIPMPGYRAR